MDDLADLDARLSAGRESTFGGMRHGTRLWGVSIGAAFGVVCVTATGFVAMQSFGFLASLAALIAGAMLFGVLRLIEMGRPHVWRQLAVYVRTHVAARPARRGWGASTVDPMSRTEK